MSSSPLDVAVEAARRGGSIVEKYFREGVVIRNKDDGCNLVSDADVESEHAIAEVIAGAFPDHAIVGEEAYRGDAGAPHAWIVDPLDGTNNFAHGLPHFAVSIAYFRDGEPQCAVIHNPARGDWFVARKGEGAFHNERKVRVSEHRELNEVLIGVGFYYDRGAMMEATLAAIRDLFRREIHGIRRFGTASLDLCQVGMGNFGAFFEYELSAWDFAAGMLFVQEAGGRVTTCHGHPLPMERSSVLASNGTLHDAVLEIVRRHLV